MDAIVSFFKALIDAFTASPMDVIMTGHAGAEISLPILIVGAIGVIECLFGLKLLRLEMLAFGFGAGFFLGKLIAGIDAVAGLLSAPWMEYALMGVLGIVCTIIAYKFLRFALMLGITAAVFFVLSPMLAGMLPTELVAKLAAVAVGLLVGLIAQKMLKTVVILVTTAMGAFLIAYSFSGVLQNYIVRLPSMTIILLACFAVVGLSTQVKGIKKK